MAFSNPLALILLILLPLIVIVARPRRRWGQRAWLSLAVRLTLTISLILALAGLQLTRTADRLAVVFLLDESDSISAAAHDQANSFIRSALSQLAPGDRAGLIVFGQNALIDRPLSDSHELGTIASAPIRTNTNIGGAVQLGLAMFPDDAARRIVVISDGGQNQGDAQSAAELAHASGVQLDSVLLPGSTDPAMAVSAVHAPDTVTPGQQFDLSVTVQSQIAGTATLTVVSQDAVIGTPHQIQVKPGDNQYIFSLTATAAGFNDFQVHLEPTIPEAIGKNKILAGFTQVIGPPRILLITMDPLETAGLLPALQKDGLQQVDLVTLTDLLGSLTTMVNYKSIILANVPATVLSNAQMKNLQSYVRDLGGGLVVIGGPNSYGVGGYYQTPLEETLPVNIQITDPKRLPRLTMTYVIDRSGSMETIEQGNSVTNLELSKEAISRSLNFLQATDRAGVLSFDSNPEWLVPLQNVANRKTINALVGTLRPGGGTDIRAAIAEIVKTLPADPSTVKHVILLTDGGADPTGIVDLVTQMYQQYGITVTSIGIGSQVPPFMADIAKAGHGIYYNLTNLQNIPQIFTAETVLATHSYLMENPFTPHPAADSPILNGITSMPPLLGYVATSPKDAASVLLTAPNQYNDPILADWQYGLGRVVAFTSDASGRWAKNWQTWDQFGRFWSQAVNWTIPIAATGNQLETHVEQRGAQTVLVAEARTASNDFLNSLSLTATIADPKLTDQQVTLQQVAPGRYEAPFVPAVEGAYFIRVGGSDPNTPDSSVTQTFGWVLSYSPEYALTPPDTGLLGSIAQTTGGSLITDSPARAVAHDLAAAQAAVPLWPYLLLIAALLLPIDIASRRLLITRGDWQKIRHWLQSRRPVGLRPAYAGAAAHAQDSRFSQLNAAKARAEAVTKASNAAFAETTPPVPIASGTPQPATPLAPIPEIKPPSAESRTLAAKLLENRRRQNPP